MTNQTTQTEAPSIIALPDPITPSAIDTAPADTSGVNWEDMSTEAERASGEDVVEITEGDTEVITPPVSETPPATPAPVPTQAPTVAVPPTPVAPVAATEPATQVVPPVAPVVQPPVQPQVAPIPAPTPTFDYGKWEAEQRTGLEKLYAINEEDAQRLQTEPELVLPKMAANMHFEVTRAVLTAVQSMIPDFLTQHNAVVSADQEARNAFYSANPDLTDPKLEPAVIQVAKMYRAANPTAPREVAVKTIGDMVRMSLGLSAPAPAASQTLQDVITPPAPAPKPFSPARGGGGGQVKAPNPWDEFSNRDDF